VPRRLVALLIALVGTDAAAQPAAFAVQTIPTEGRVVAAAIADFDGDGRAELLSIVSRGVGPEESRELQMRAIDAAGRVAEKPGWSAPVPSGAAGYDVADVDGRPGLELLFLERDGVSILSRAGGATSWRRARVPSPPTVAVRPDERGIDRIRLARPELGAGRLLVPGLGDAWLLDAGGAVLAHLAVGGRANYLVPTRPGPEIGESELELYFDVPTLEVADIDGDGRSDVVAATRHALRIFRQRDDGTFPTDPDRELLFRLMSLEDQVRNSGSVRSELADLDRDGRADLLVSQTSGGLLRAKNRTRIHLNRGGTFDLAHPDREYVREGGVAADELLDLDGDGRPDWLRVFAPFGLLEIAQLFLQRSVDLEVAIHRSDGHGGFEKEPWLSRSLTFAFDFETLRPRGFAGSLLEDWNRDGHRDWLSSAGGSAVEVWLGGPTYRFASAQSRDPLDSSGRVATGDLDGDGLPDWVVYDPRRSDVPIRVGRNLGNLPGSPATMSAPKPEPAR